MQEQIELSTVEQGSRKMKTYFLPSKREYRYVVKSDDEILYAGPSLEEAKSVYQDRLEQSSN